MSGPLSHVAFFLPSLAEGGAERVAVNALKILNAKRKTVMLLEDRVAYPHDAEQRVIGRNFLRGGSPATRLKEVIQVAHRLRRAKHELGVEACVSFTTWPNILNVLAGGPGRSVLVVQNHESTSIRGRSAPFVKRLVRHAYPRADAILTASHSLADDLVKNFGVGPERIVTLHNALDLEQIDQERARPIEPLFASVMAGETLVTAGRLVEQKGQWFLLRVFAELRKSRPRARLVILGARGGLEDQLVALARDLGLSTWAPWAAKSDPSEASVVFTGFQENPFAFLARATLFVFPSLWEGFGNALLEAMACGAPSVSTDCEAGPREILAGTQRSGPLTEPVHLPAGVLMPTFPRSWRASDAPLLPAEATWVATLVELLGDEAGRARLGRGARARAEEFGLASTASGWNFALQATR